MKLLTINIVYPIQVLIITTFSFLSVNVNAFTERLENMHNIETRNIVIMDSGIHNITLSVNDSLQYFKERAIIYAKDNNVEASIVFIKKFIVATGDLSIINDHLFSSISSSPVYKEFKDKYIPKISFISIFYVFSGFLGIFMFFLLNIKRNNDKLGTLLISLFVLFHSLFIIHLSLYVINYQYYAPHFLFVSTTFSFLYGPLLYFYFKRQSINYKFKWIDVLHLIPSILLFAYIFPYYVMTKLEKFNVIFDQTNLLLPGAHLIILVKVVSLIAYAYLIIRIYLNDYKSIKKHNKYVYLWQRNIIALFVVYIFAYLVYSANIIELINAPYLFHAQIIVMSMVVLYVTYIAYQLPEIFKGKVKLLDSDIFKYKKSGLTPSYSLELKDQLINLLVKDKMYTNNNISLEFLAEKLDTSRHNTSQVINEHFNMSFSELINFYRINDATEILKNDKYQNLNIIDVAFEVGFNNKVSFNKSFKKYHSQTPSEFINALQK
ncbi:MAG: AraC family transcriptional regulator [Flavobacteriaceae bacterium]